MTDPIRLERRGFVAILTIDRPDRMNSLSRQTVSELGRFGRELASDDSVRAVVLTGAGDKAFCAGADLKERLGLTEDQVREMLLNYRAELAWLDSSRMPVIAAINGVALGGGLEVAMACDLRVAAEHALLGLPETGLGIIPGAGGTQRLPRLVGEARAKELILRAARISAKEAHGIGLVNHVVPAGQDLLEETLRWIEPIAEGAPIAQRSALRAIRAALTVPLAQGLEVEREAYDACLRSEDRVEALRAFSEKRKPTFTGR